MRYAAFRGLNLTFEVREGIIKHSHDYSADQFPELAEYLLDQRPPLEAQLIDLADEIAYDTADLDDGYESRLLTLPQIRNGVPVFDRFYREAEKTYPAAIEKLKFNEAVKRILDRMVGDLIRNLQSQIKAAAFAAWKMCAPARGGWPHSAPKWKKKGEAPRSFSTRISISAQRWSRKRTMPSA